MKKLYFIIFLLFICWGNVTADNKNLHITVIVTNKTESDYEISFYSDNKRYDISNYFQRDKSGKYIFKANSEVIIKDIAAFEGDFSLYNSHAMNFIISPLPNQEPKCLCVWYASIHINKNDIYTEISWPLKAKTRALIPRPIGLIRECNYRITNNFERLSENIVQDDSLIKWTISVINEKSEQIVEPVQMPNEK